MSKDSKPTHANDGYVPMTKGYQPLQSTGKEQAGHVPTTGQSRPGPGTPPNQGSGGSKK